MPPPTENRKFDLEIIARMISANVPLILYIVEEEFLKQNKQTHVFSVLIVDLKLARVHFIIISNIKFSLHKDFFVD